MKKSIVLGSIVVAAGLLTGCGTTINLTDYQNKIRQPIQVPDVCKDEYSRLKDVPSVAILKFANNSNFGKANTTNSNTDANYQKASVTGIVAGQGGIGIGHAEAGKMHSTTNSTSRVVDPKLDKAISSALEGTLAQMGGASIYSREDLDKVMKEQKLQQSGLVDEDTAVEVGKLAGVRYIITGSIDSVTQKYEDYTQAASSATQNNNQRQTIGSMLFKAALNAGASAASGMKITTKVTFKIIDVKTGKIVFSTQEEETKNIGQIKNPTYDQIIGGIKDDIMEAIKSSESAFSDYFSPKGYILQVKADKDRKNYIAQINLGKKDKIKPEQTFSVYQFDEITDPVTGQTSCDKSFMNVKLKVSKNQIQSKRSWTVAEGEDAPKIRAGQIIKRDAIKKSMF